MQLVRDAYNRGLWHFRPLCHFTLKEDAGLQLSSQWEQVILNCTGFSAWGLIFITLH